MNLREVLGRYAALFGIGEAAQEALTTITDRDERVLFEAWVMDGVNRNAALGWHPGGDPFLTLGAATYSLVNEWLAWQSAVASLIGGE